MSKLSVCSNDDLVQWWKNAKITGCNCAGHHKAKMNEAFEEEYVEEMNRRGIEVLANYDGGVFNGEGSY